MQRTGDAFEFAWICFCPQLYKTFVHVRLFLQPESQAAALDLALTLTSRPLILSAGIEKCQVKAVAPYCNCACAHQIPICVTCTLDRPAGSACNKVIYVTTAYLTFGEQHHSKAIGCSRVLQLVCAASHMGVCSSPLQAC